MSQTSPPTTEGRVDFVHEGEKYQTWYKIVGDLKAALAVGPDGRRRRPPLVTLHGGPGSAHNYLLSMADLVQAKHGISAVVFYDQLGSGNSTHLPSKPKSFWTPELFMAELDNLLRGLRIVGSEDGGGDAGGGADESYDLLGHSWGGMLGAQFASSAGPTQPSSRSVRALRRLILSDAPASMSLWEDVAAGLVSGMPADVQATLKKHEDAGTTDTPEYQEAMGVFYEKHLCRVQPMPEDVLRAFQVMEEDPTVYHTMNGPSEFHVIGSLKEWTIIPELHRITVPTLLLNGRYDEAQDKCVLPFFQHINKVKWYTFAEGSHMPHWEERERYMEVVSQFLTLD